MLSGLILHPVPGISIGSLVSPCFHTLPKIPFPPDSLSSSRPTIAFVISSIKFNEVA